MNRFQLEHIIRAAGAISGEDNLVVVGSAALLGACPEAADLAAVELSKDVDLYPLAAPEKADVIDGAIGEGSLFAETFQVYAHGSGPEVTARLPGGWRERLVPVRTRDQVTGWCLSPADLAVAKLDAGRPKDLRFVQVMLSCNLVALWEVEQLAARLTDGERRAVVLDRLRLMGDETDAG